MKKLIELQKKMEALAKKSVVVGIPHSENSRKGEDLSNIELAYIHEFGCAVRKIPARPFLITSIRDNSSKVSSFFSKQVKAYLNSEQTVDGAYSMVGEVAESLVKDRFGSSLLTPNSKRTIKEKKSNKPLIDTGQLRQSIKYEVRDA